MELFVVVVFAALASNVIAFGRYGPWPPHPERPWPHHPERTKTVTITTTFPPICSCPLQRNVTTTVPAICHCPLESISTTTLTKNLPANCTASTTRLLSTGYSNSTATGTGVAKPTCSLTSFPDSFFIKDSDGLYLSVDPTSNKVSGVLSNKLATVFHLATAVIGPNTGVTQLAFNGAAFDSNSTVEYRAFIHNSGGPVRFFGAEIGPDFEGKFHIVEAYFVNSAGCDLQLVAFSEVFTKDPLKFTEICGTTLWLDRGPLNGGCARVVLSIVPA